MKLVLASSSKQRQDILKMLGLEYNVVTSDVEEKSNETKPDKYVEELSLNKAISVSKQINYKAIIVGCDTIVYAHNKIYQKPKSKIEASKTLKELSCNKNTFYTGMTIIDLYNNKVITTSSYIDVYFKNIKDEEVNWYIDNEEKIFKCCGYVPSGKAAFFIDKVDGDLYTLFGLSPSVLLNNLNVLGYNINDFELERNVNEKGKSR